MKKESTLAGGLTKKKVVSVGKTKGEDTKAVQFMRLFDKVYDRIGEARKNDSTIIEVALCDGEREFVDKLTTFIRKYAKDVTKVAQTRDFIVLQINLTP